MSLLLKNVFIRKKLLSPLKIGWYFNNSSEILKITFEV